MTTEKNIVNEADERVYTLSQPFVFEGTSYTELTLDFDVVFGEDLLKIDKIFAADPSNSMTFIKALSLTYQLHVAALAAKVPFEFFGKLPGKDVSRIGQRAQNFLLV